MKIDTHQHFWKYNSKDYPWIGKEMEVLAQDRLPADLKPLIQKEGIDGTIAVQARQVIEETEALLQMAKEYDFIRGVVGWVDLRSTKVEEQLERYKDNPKMVGVRHVVQDEPDENFVLGTEFLQGMGKLKQADLIYDILIFPNQLPANIEMVKKFPEQTFILNHMAKPYVKKAELFPWAEDIKRLAACDNVFCKISGMVTEAEWDKWKPEDFHPYMEVVMEAFGVDRVTLGSDWPVCTLAGEYSSVMSISKNYISALSTDEQMAIWEDNPHKIYQLK